MDRGTGGEWLLKSPGCSVQDLAAGNTVQRVRRQEDPK